MTDIKNLNHDNFESELDVGEILSGQFNPKYVPAY